MTLPSSHKDAAISIRLLWPFMRVASMNARAIEVVTRSGISPAELGNPDTRVPHRLVMQLLRETVNELGDPTIGLRAGEHLEAGDFAVLEYAARSALTLGDAIECMARYFRILNDAIEVSLVPDGNNTEVRFRIVDGVPQPAAANDFVITSSLGFSRRNVAIFERPVELRFAHAKPSYFADYSRLDAPVKFGAAHNAIILRSSRLRVPMLRANADVSAAFESHAQRLVDRLEERSGTSGRVREALTGQLGMGEVTMRKTARRLGMSIATLRRRLETEGTTFSNIVEDLRKNLAARYLAAREPAVSEIAFLLGFADVASFDRAFKRWMGVSPTKYRATASTLSAP